MSCLKQSVDTALLILNTMDTFDYQYSGLDIILGSAPANEVPIYILFPPRLSSYIFMEKILRIYTQGVEKTRHSFPERQRKFPETKLEFTLYFWVGSSSGRNAPALCCGILNGRRNPLFNLNVKAIKIKRASEKKSLEWSLAAEPKHCPDTHLQKNFPWDRNVDRDLIVRKHSTAIVALGMVQIVTFPKYAMR